MATAKIWHYYGHTGDEQNGHTQLAREPYVSRQQVTTSGVAAASAASPAGTHLARIEVTTGTRYRVIPPGGSGSADANDPALFVESPTCWNWVHLPPGSTISLIEAA